MKLKISPACLGGDVTPPPSKSQAHRAVIAAALAKGSSHIAPLSPSMDILATLGAVEALGASYEKKTGVVTGCDAVRIKAETLPQIDCAESGSTLRFLIPVALAVAGGGIFSGRGRLMQRPQEPYFHLFQEKGITYQQDVSTLTVEGTLPPGRYSLPGDVSSQFVTGLLFALPLLAGDSEIEITTPLQSKEYVTMTLDVLSHFGIQVHQKQMQHFWIPGGQRYCAADLQIEADMSQAAFFAAARVLGQPVTILGLNQDSKQGDKVIFSILKQLQAKGTQDVDVSQCPDLVPAIALVAALRDGELTILSNAARLRAKESDRLAAVTRQLNTLGANITEGPDFLRIQGVAALHGGETDSENDHRIAMMLAIGAAVAKGDVILTGAESVQKSYPSFWSEYVRLGGKITALDP
ncbi:MAG: 3-phosphoshikimate 1-carboxyvinyltransferase [Oscillospiraceae bacterium]|nr:3-phosphoshikimate 1-carboxyvinyltransferase [Oscillospiraceae bacterium]